MKRTIGPLRIAPNTCLYEVADQRKRMIAEACGFPVQFEAAAIENETGNKTIAIIPLDDSSIENALLFAAAPDLLDACKKALDYLQRSDAFRDGSAYPALVNAIAKAECRE